MVESVQGVGGLNHIQQKIEFVDDTLSLSEEFKKNVAIPYFKDIYKDLVQQSDKKEKGVNRVSLLTVIFICFILHSTLLCPESSVKDSFQSWI